MKRATPLASLAAGVVLAILSTVLAGCRPESAPDAASQSVRRIESSESAESEPAFDYPGGWLGDGACVDICGVTADSPVPRPPAVVCFDPEDAECQAKTGTNDYDYLMLSQHWLPTFCQGLEAGYDSTVTHQAGARCGADAPSRLTVHGLWPNYTAGFPQCCGDAKPLNPSQTMAWPVELRDRLQAEQPDPTTSGLRPALCQIFNHEWQKHGTCFLDTGDTDQDARKYFETGLELADRLAEATAQVGAWAGTSQPRSALEALYTSDVQVLCDSHQPQRLLEIHTCWSSQLEQVDCPYSKGFGSLTACGEEVSFPRS